MVRTAAEREVVSRCGTDSFFPVRHGGLRLAEVVRAVAIKYQAAAQGVKRFAETLADDPERKRFVSKLRRELSSI